MNTSTALVSGLCLPDLDIEALIQGRMIAAMSNTFRNPPNFLLCPIDTSQESPNIESQYHPGFLKSVNATINSITGPETIIVKAWAKFESCRIYSEIQDLEAISKLTVWSPENLQKIVQARKKIFLLSLRIYRLPQPIELEMSPLSLDKVGKYIRLRETFSGQESLSVLTNKIFATRQKQLIDLSSPSHPELENLHNEIATLEPKGFGAQALEQSLGAFLGWSQLGDTSSCDSDLVWIQQIAQIGNSSDGHTFEKLVRKSLIKLGFSNSETNPKASLNPDATGGAGGIDIYCEAPYPVVGECKASRHNKVPNSVTAQLIHLGITHLGQAQFAQSIKLILAAGPLTEPANKAAIENAMNVLRPETLQRLTELKAAHPGSVDLLKLKPCLEKAPFGEDADDKVNRFIDKIWQQLQVRANLVQRVKAYLQNTGQDSVEDRIIFGAYVTSLHSGLPTLEFEEVCEILIELASPLAGYLGRKSTGQNDTYYFLRDLIVAEPEVN